MRTSCLSIRCSVLVSVVVGLTLSGCPSANSSAKPGDSGANEDGGSTRVDGGKDASTTAQKDSGTAAHDAAVASTPGAAKGTVKATYSLDGAVEKTFTCVMDDKFSFTYLAPPNNIFAGSCVNGGGQNGDLANFVNVGFSVPAMLGTVTNAKDVSTSAMTLQVGTTQLMNAGFVDASTVHTLTVTSWDAATLHIVGTGEATWTIPGNAHAGTLKLEFDVFAKSN